MKPLITRTLENVGLRKKRIVDTPWQRFDGEQRHTGKEGLGVGARLLGMLPVGVAQSLAAAERTRKTMNNTAALDAMLHNASHNVVRSLQGVDKSISKTLEEKGGTAAGGMEKAERDLHQFMDNLTKEVTTTADVVRLMQKAPKNLTPLCLPTPCTAFLTTLLQAHKPTTILDCGSYVGLYSACVMSVALKDHPIIVAVENKTILANTCQGIINNVKTKNIVCHWGSVDAFAKDKAPIVFDFILLDHNPILFFDDLQTLIAKGKVKKGCLIAAHVELSGDGGNRSAYHEYLTKVVADKRFKPMHCPPTSALHVIRYLG